MRLMCISKDFVLICFGLVLITTYIVNPGYYDRIYASFYNMYSEPCSYCGDDEHGVSYCSEKAVDEGAYGRWIIPDVGIDVACYVADSKAQEITDAKDSAALIQRADTTLLADHNYQGFSVIKKCEPGTIAYMDNGESVKRYVCTKIVEGYNVGTHLTDLNGNVVDFNDVGGFTNYTCHFFSDKITIVHFAPVEEAEEVKNDSLYNVRGQEFYKEI